jgi:phage tail tape-measure protein
MDYTDWYNIVNEMNNIAALGGPIEIAGETLNGSMESAANLILQGAEALTTIDTGEFKVDLSKIGTGIASSAEMMGDDVSAGIKAMSDAQVEMLDGLIAMLELIVAMEELGDIDVEGNGIDFHELFTDSFEVDGTEYVKWQDDAIDAV